jgi:hypothetical protein
MDLIISSFTSFDDDGLPFHVDRFSKNAVGLIVYMSDILSWTAIDRERVKTSEISSDVVFYTAYQWTSRNAFILCSEIPFNSTLYIYSFYLNP